ncbi:acid-sensing ion channel 4-like, partial [Mustelus asterias]
TLLRSIEDLENSRSSLCHLSPGVMPALHKLNTRGQQILTIRQNSRLSIPDARIQKQTQTATNQRTQKAAEWNRVPAQRQNDEEGPNGLLLRSGTLYTDQAVSRVFTRYGKCYTFNANKTNIKKAKQSGMGSGLEIMLDIQQDEYLPIWQETDETSFEAGIRVQIHNQNEPPYIHELGFGVPPGFQTFVACQEQRLTYLPRPWGECRSVGNGRLLPGYDDYSITACRIHCEKEAVVSKCHCRMVHMPGHENICSPKQYVECADKTLDELVSTSNLSCKCETPCSLTRYGKELSMVKIPSRGSSKFLAKRYNTSEQNIK